MIPFMARITRRSAVFAALAGALARPAAAAETTLAKPEPTPDTPRRVILQLTSDDPRTIRRRASARSSRVRGSAPLDVVALATVLERVSTLAWCLRDRLQELDINPLLVRPVGQGVIAADALAVMRTP